MTEERKIWIASWAIGKSIDREELYYCDDMNGNESLTDDVWEYVEECQEIGRKAFREKYSKYKLYF